MKQSTSGKRHYEPRFFPRSVKTIWWTFVIVLTFCPISQWWKIGKFGPVTFKFFGFHAVVKEHVHGKFRRAKCSGYCMMHAYRKRTRPKTKTLQSVATARTAKMHTVSLKTRAADRLKILIAINRTNATCTKIRHMSSYILHE